MLFRRQYGASISFAGVAGVHVVPRATGMLMSVASGVR